MKAQVISRGTCSAAFRSPVQRFRRRFHYILGAVVVCAAMLGSGAFRLCQADTTHYYVGNQFDPDPSHNLQRAFDCNVDSIFYKCVSGQITAKLVVKSDAHEIDSSQTEFSFTLAGPGISLKSSSPGVDTYGSFFRISGGTVVAWSLSAYRKITNHDWLLQTCYGCGGSIAFDNSVETLYQQVAPGVGFYDKKLVGSNINQRGTWTRYKPRIVLDPGHGKEFTGGVLQYERPPSPTFHLHEDDLTLIIAKAAKVVLDPDYEVLMTRTGATEAMAPAAPADCTLLNKELFPDERRHGCIADLEWRRFFAEEHEADVLVSIHTNAANNANDHTTNGATAHFKYFLRSYNKHSVTLANELVDAVSALGLSNGGSSYEELRVLSGLMDSALVEVGYLTNSVRARGQTITDEQRLNDPDFLQQAGGAVKTAIDNYFADKARGE